MKKLTRKQAIKLIQSSEGKMFSVLFKRRTDGNLREMNCRTGVKKYLKNPEAPPRQRGQNLINVYDVQVQGYRCIPHEGIRQVTIGGEVYKVR